MHSTKTNYPTSFQMLRQDLIKIAVEILDNLNKNGFREGVSEMVAIGSSKLIGVDKRTDNRVHLIPHPKGWGLVCPEGKTIFFISSSRSDAMVRARAKAKMEKLRLYIHSLSGIIADSESFAVNKPVRQDIAEWQEYYFDESFLNPGLKVQQKTRDAIRKAKVIAEKVQNGLSLSGGEGKLKLDY